MLLEDTRSIEVPLVSALAMASLPFVVVNLRQVRDLAEVTGWLGKTDVLDARVLARFAEAVRPPLRSMRDIDTQNLNELARGRNQLITMLVAEKNRLGLGTGSVLPKIEAHIKWLEKELKYLDKKLRETLLRSPVWRQKDDLLRSVPGVGEQVSVSLLTYFPELGALDRKQIAALVGAAPINRDSGIIRGRRTVWGGWSRVRGTLYMGTLVATRYNPVIRVYYQRFLATDKAKKVALVACIRKLPTILDSMVKSDRYWDPQTITP